LPSETLAPFVHHLWSVRWALRTPFTAEALPHPTAQFLFEVGSGAPRAEVAGVRTGRFSRRLVGSGRVFGITFRPAAFQQLLRAPMSSLTDRVVPIGSVLGREGDAWAREILDASELDEQISMAHTFLAPRLLPLGREVVRVRDMVERLMSDRPLLRVEDVAEALALDVRSLQRQFRRYVGVNPKWVLQRYRLHEAVEQLKGPNPPALAALAASLGYADQAHFARDFKLVVGRTARAFRG
jgi:AraC-like DNA-binding protein